MDRTRTGTLPLASGRLSSNTVVLWAGGSVEGYTQISLEVTHSSTRLVPCWGGASRDPTASWAVAFAVTDRGSCTELAGVDDSWRHVKTSAERAHVPTDLPQGSVHRQTNASETTRWILRKFGLRCTDEIRRGCRELAAAYPRSSRLLCH